MFFRIIASTLLLFSLFEPALAVPSLLPLIPIVGVLIAKGAMLVGAFFFFVLSLYKEKKQLFLIWGSVFFVVFIILMAIF